MENFQRDMEKSRLKREVSEDLKSKWSVLLVNSTGKVHRISYLKAVIIAVASCVVISVTALAITAIIASISINNNEILKKEIIELEKRSKSLKKENETLIARLALLDAAGPENISPPLDKGEKERSETKIEGKETDNTPPPPKIESPEKEEIVKIDDPEEENILLAKDDDSAIENEEGSPVNIKGYSIKKMTSEVLVKFNIINTSSHHKPVSGFIFAILKNDGAGDEKSMISPYSKISMGIPLNPRLGQYFSISRFKPVSIKFPGEIDLDKFNNVELLVYSVDNKLILKKGFIINEKK